MVRFALLAAVVICSASPALAHRASEAEKRIGAHLWTVFPISMCPTPEPSCARDRISGEVTVIGFATGVYGIGRYLEVRLNSGEVGFVLAAMTLETEDPELAGRQREEESRRRMAKSEAELHARFAKEAAELKAYNAAEDR